MLSPTRALGRTIAFWNGAAGGDGAKPTATPRMKDWPWVFALPPFTEFGRDLGSSWKSSACRGMGSSRFRSESEVRNASLFLLRVFKKTFCAVQRGPEYFFRELCWDGG